MALVPFWGELARSASVRFALVGDYGVNNANERAVAPLIKQTFLPDFIATLGDNQYGGAGDYDVNVGQYYHEFLTNYAVGCVLQSHLVTSTVGGWSPDTAVPIQTNGVWIAFVAPNGPGRLFRLQKP